MKRKILRLGRPILLIAALFGAVPAAAQDIERVLDKMLNPLPEFDPFEKPAETPRFFPDETDKRARELMVDALTNRQDAVREHLQFFINEDARLQKQHGAATGLTEPRARPGQQCDCEPRALSRRATGSAQERFFAGAKKIPRSDHQP